MFLRVVWEQSLCNGEHVAASKWGNQTEELGASADFQEGGNDVVAKGNTTRAENVSFRI